MKARHLLAVLFSRTHRSTKGLAGAFTDRSSTGSHGTRAPSRRRALFALSAFVALAALLVGAISIASGAEPTVTAPTVSAVRYTTATVKGTVDPADHETSYFFEYATAANFSGSEIAGSGSLPEGAGATPVGAQLTGLKPSTTYHLRLVAVNTEGEEREAVAASTFTTEAVAKPTVSIEPVTTFNASSATFVAHVNPNSPQAEGATDTPEQEAFRTEWKFVCTPACTGNLSGTQEADSTSHEVTGEATNLKPGRSTYEVRLVATNVGGAQAAGPVSFTTPSAAPTIESVSVSPGLTEAEFSATINPGNLATTYRFQYGPTTTYGSATAPKTIPAGSAPVQVSAKGSGLSPAGSYHFRLVVENTAGPAASADQTFSTLTESASGSCPNEQLRAENRSLALPDCRAYELVSPPFKFGQPITPFQIPYVSTDGSHIDFASLGAFGEPASDDETPAGLYVASRLASGWSSQPLNVSSQLYLRDETENYDFSSSLDRMLSIAAPLASKPVDLRFLTRDLSGNQTEIGPMVPPESVAQWTADLTRNGASASPEGSYPPVHNHGLYQGATGSFSRLLFSIYKYAGQPINWRWPGDTTEAVRQGSLYEYAGVGNSEPELVAVTNPTTLVAAAAAEGLPHINEAAHLISNCGALLGGSPTDSSGSGGKEVYNAISASGETVFFTALGRNTQSSCANVIATPQFNEVYARVGRARTVAISTPTTGAGGDCSLCDESSPAEAYFAGASASGSKAFFYTTQKLLPGAAGMSLYEFDFEAPNPHDRVSVIATDLAPGGNAADGEPVGGVVRISGDGSRVYFVSTAKLATNRDQLGAEARPGDDNLYLADTESGEVTFIGALGEQDVGDWNPADRRPVESTPADGRYLLFPSVNDLTPDAAGGSSQLYRYEAPSASSPSGHLVRISVGAGGFNQNGNGAAPPESIFAPLYNSIVLANEFELAYAGPRPAQMSEDGSRVFFESPAALTPGALNDACAISLPFGCVRPAANVYEWHDGQISLLSDGRDTGSYLISPASALLGADPSGSDVFLTSSDQLTPEDTDSLVDIYDLKVGGGTPVPRQVPGCQGDTCQGGGTVPPPTAQSGTGAFAGPGNQTARAKHKKHHKHKKKHQKPQKKKLHKRRGKADAENRHRISGLDRGGND